MAPKILQFPQRITPERQARADANLSLEELRVQLLAERLEAMYSNPRTHEERRLASLIDQKLAGAPASTPFAGAIAGGS